MRQQHVSSTQPFSSICPQESLSDQPACAPAVYTLFTWNDKYFHAKDQSKGPKLPPFFSYSYDVQAIPKLNSKRENKFTRLNIKRNMFIRGGFYWQMKCPVCIKYLKEENIGKYGRAATANQIKGPKIIY